MRTTFLQFLHGDNILSMSFRVEIMFLGINFLADIFFPVYLKCYFSLA